MGICVDLVEHITSYHPLGQKLTPCKSMKFLFSLAVSIFQFNYSIGQITINGKVFNHQTQEAIPYANIGILDTEIGTLSNEDGSFSIKMPAKYENRNLLFSSIGYEKKSISINSINTSSPLQVSLTELILELDEVIILSEKFKKRKVVLGNGKSLLLHGIILMDSIYSGSAVALLIDKSQYPTFAYIQRASLHIAKNLMPSFKVRIRLLAVDSLNGQKPGDDIISEQIIEESTMKKGWLNFLFPSSHQLKQDSFFLTFEWILNKADRKYIGNAYEEYMNLYPDRVDYDTTTIDGEEVIHTRINHVVAGTIFGTTPSQKDRNNFVTYSRYSSFGKWERSSSTLSAKIEIANYRLDTASVNNISQDYQITDYIDQWAKAFKEEQNIPGLQLAVMKDDSLVYSKAFGYSDKIKKVKANTNTQFRIASVSKTLTSAGLMKLEEQGKVDLDNTVHHYVPSFPQKKQPITVRQLMGHLGGIRDYYGKSWEEEIFIQEHYNNSTEAISMFKNNTLVAEPGSQFIYTPFGFILLGAVIESASNRSYLEYMSKEIWGPLQMNFTFGDITDSTMIHKSNFYFFTGEEAIPYDLSYSYPSGGLVSTSEDLVNFGSALLEGKLLENAQLEKTFETQYTSNGEATGYGLGWYIGEDLNGNKVWYHAGELPSTGSMLLIYPEYKIVIALLANSPIISNTDDGFSSEIQGLGEIIYNHQGW